MATGDERNKDIAMPPIENDIAEVGSEKSKNPERNESGTTGNLVEANMPASSEVENAATPVSPPTETRTETPQEVNFRALRESKEQIERERNEAIAKLAEYEKQKLAATPPTLHESDDFGLGLGEDDLAEGKHLKKINAHIKKLEQQVQSYQTQSSEAAIETKLKQQYPDFDKVVSKNNIELLRTLHPEIANTINSSSDLYSKAVSAYTMIKKLGILKEDNFQQDRELAQKNAAKPKPLTSVSPQQGDSPLSNANAFANGLTEDLKKQLYREMIDAAKKS